MVATKVAVALKIRTSPTDVGPPMENRNDEPVPTPMPPAENVDAAGVDGTSK